MYSHMSDIAFAKAYHQLSMDIHDPGTNSSQADKNKYCRMEREFKARGWYDDYVIKGNKCHGYYPDLLRSAGVA